MYNKKSRYALMVVFAISALVSVYYIQYQLAAIAGLLFCFVLWSHFKYSSIVLASKYFKDKDYDRVEKILAEVDQPDRLAKNRRGYYEFMKANIALDKEDYEAAEVHFQIASRFPLGGQNDKAYVLIHLANLALRKKDAERAKIYAKKAQELATTSRAKEIIETIEKNANNLA
jgi:divalent metal cation (Fe/Co/Zn/Cd) transporter